MKLAFVLLMLGFTVLLSEQQLLPYHIQSRVISPWAVLDALSERDLYSYLIARIYRFPINPSLYSHQSSSYQENTPVIVQSSPFATKPEDQYADAQSRNKFDGIQDAGGSVNPRFLLNFVTTIGSSNSVYNPLQKTIYYFTTATTTFTFTTTCISTAQFAGAGASASILCRRRRDLLEVLSVLRDIEKVEAEAEISPSHVLESQVVPTARAMPGFDEQQFHLASSKEEEELSPDTFEPAGRDDAVMRYKRLFISTTIVTTYVFSTVTTTRALSANLAAAGALTCRPAQFTTC